MDTQARAVAGRRRPTRAPAGRLALALGASLAAAHGRAAAQTVDDGLLVERRQLRATVDYTRERWSEYWEGTTKRRNENIGTLVTQAVTVSGAYGVTDRLSLVVALPHVTTEASQGVLQGQRGWQDVTVAAKYRVLETRVGGRATLGVLAVAGAGAPASDYTPDFLPMSIGLGARRAIARGFVHLADRSGLFVNAGAGRAWRSTVHLDRPAYYTDGRLTLSDEVAMPDVVDFSAAAGWQRRWLTLPVTLTGQRTLGGGDIRRQDMPFVSNRMNFTRLAARALVAPPAVPSLALSVGGARTLSGRNVGQGTAFTTGVSYAVRF